MGLALWELLLSTLHNDDETPLTCDECFAILMYLAERATDGADSDRLRTAVLLHLARCPRLSRNAFAPSAFVGM